MILSRISSRPLRSAYLWGVLIFANDMAALDRSALEHFESKVRPLLVNRCFECHSQSVAKPKGGLLLDSREGLLAGGDSGPALELGNAEGSLLIQMIRGTGEDRMPPEGKGELNALEIAALETWVNGGAAWPEGVVITDRTDGYDWGRMRQHWAFQPVKEVTLPDVPPNLEAKNGIDRFVISRLREAELELPQSASATVLVRRLFLDLLGIPPSVTEWRDWVDRLDPEGAGDLDDLAVGALIDDLLSRQQYGERWGRHWLDLARYSDVGGWTQDNRARPMAWQYRDWVVKAFNADMPYDEFVRNQIVGDQFGRDESVGTGFFALGPTYASDGGDPDSIAQAKSETLDDRVDTFSRAFLGLTISCARCHDHKFDPVPIEDYYSIAGVFNNAGEREQPLVSTEIVQAYRAHQDALKALDGEIKGLRKLAKDEGRELTEAEKSLITEKEQDLKRLRASGPKKYAFAHTIHDRSSEDMRVALRGNLLKPGDIAPRRFLRIIAGENREHFSEGSGRTQLAQAVIDPENPLTARVMVNRVWLHHFGRALVRTPSNFGMLGETPTHPELLDWLAARFVESGWSIKALHRLILSSATYQSSSAFQAGAFERDGGNRLIWRMNPRRMDAETWRDSLMMVSGGMDDRIGGAAVDDIVSSPRRTLYAKVSRNNPLASDNYLRLFDFPIPRASNAQRTTSVVPQQFLFMLNSQFMHERARAIAARFENEAGSIRLRVRRAYEVLYGRFPSERELDAANRFLTADSSPGSQLTRWEQYCQVLLSSNEFMYIR